MSLKSLLHRSLRRQFKHFRSIAEHRPTTIMCMHFKMFPPSTPNFCHLSFSLYSPGVSAPFSFVPRFPQTRAFHVVCCHKFLTVCLCPIQLHFVSLKWRPISYLFNICQEINCLLFLGKVSLRFFLRHICSY